MSQTPNILYLFYPNSVIGWIICLITRTPYAHTAISVGGVLWDSSESRGDFNRSEIDLSKRKHVAVPFAGDLSVWLKVMQGTKYDWLGVFGWVFKWNMPNKYFCFEASWEALKLVGIVSGVMPENLTAQHLLVSLAKYKSLSELEGDPEWRRLRSIRSNALLANSDIYIEKVARHILLLVGGHLSVRYHANLSETERRKKQQWIVACALLVLACPLSEVIDLLEDNKPLILKVEDCLMIYKISIRE